MACRLCKTGRPSLRGSFRNLVHRRDAEFAKGEFFVLSGERPESTNAWPSDLAYSY